MPTKDFPSIANFNLKDWPVRNLRTRNVFISFRLGSNRQPKSEMIPKQYQKGEVGEVSIFGVRYMPIHDLSKVC